MGRRVSLYIEDTEIKLLVTNGNQVEKWGSLMLDAGLVSEGVILDENRVAEGIKELFKLQGVNYTSVTVGISGLNSVFRVISIPEVPRNLLPEAVSNEASRVLPMPLSQVYFSYQPLPSAKGEIRLFLAAYPRNSTDILLSVVRKAGLRAQVMDLAPLALARCVNTPQAILLNAWLTFVDIIVLSERIPLVIRSLSLPVEGTSSQERLASITEELTRTITFYNSTYQDKQLDTATPICVSGNAVSDEESLKYLESFGYPVSVLKPVLNYSETFTPAQYMVDIGLAVKGNLPKGADSHYSMIDFNALPQAYQPAKFSWARVLIPVGAVIGIGILVYLYMALVSVNNDTLSLNNQNSALQLQIARIRAENKQVSDDIAAAETEAADLLVEAGVVQEEIDLAQQNEQFFNTTLDTLKVNLDASDADIREVVNALPAGVTINSLEYRADGTTVSGLAVSQEAILDYARELREGGHFVMVTIMAIEDLGDGNLGYTIILR
jgi:type IV pilus assembly protein PilM